MKELNFRTIDYSRKMENLELLDEGDFINQMRNVAEPFMNKYKKDGYTTIEGDIKIHYETYFLPAEESKATVFMLHGFTGFTGKFYEVIYYCLKMKYSVVALDFRGHGYSYRELDDGHHAKTYIENFDTFISDTFKVYEDVVKPNSNGKPVFIYSHSMGGGVAANLIEEHPEYFDGAVLSCPMLGMVTAGLPNWLIKILCRIMINKNGGTDYIIGAHDFDYKGEFTMKPSEAYSFNRYAYYNELRKVDTHYFSKYATYRFIYEAIRGGKKASRPKACRKADLPVLMFQSEIDGYVKPGEQKTFAKNAPDCQIVFMSGAEHELFSSQNRILNAYYYEIFSFYDKIVAEKK
ncbi:MAG: lysophospholipase [Treponemataceae bacterium]|nr:lysophospholipase [Treponemataceae bacterium]